MRRSVFGVMTPVFVLAAALCAVGLGGCAGSSPAGTQIEGLTAVSGAGGAASKPVSVPGAFPSAGGVPLYVHLFDAGSFDPDGEIVKWEWNFGGEHDGKGGWHDFTATQGDTWHWYNKPGTKVAHLRVTDDGGSKDVGKVKITMCADGNANPVAVAIADPTYGNAPLTVCLSAAGSYDPDGTIEKYEWDFDDGAGFQDFTGPSGDATHVYGAGSVFTAILRVTDDDGAESSASAEVDVNAPPVAVANADPTEGNAPLTVAFDAVGSLDSDGIIIKWEWDFDDGGGFEDYTSTAGVASYEYATYGEYTAVLRVTDNRGADGTASVAINVNAFPVAVACADPTEGPAPLAVEFSAAGSYDPDGAIEKWEWDFGEGAGFEDCTSSQGEITHEYGSTGEYTAVLRVTDEESAEDADGVEIIVLTSTWVHTWGTADKERVLSVASDAAGNVYMGGTLYNSSRRDALAIKYDSTGNLQWVKTWGGSKGDAFKRIAVDDHGDIYFAGWTDSYGQGDEECLLVKYSSSGNVLWAKTWGGSQKDNIDGIAVESGGDVVLAGYTASDGEGGRDVLLLKYDPMGTLLSAVIWGDVGWETAESLVLDASDNAYVAGRTRTTTAGGQDALIMKLDSSGTPLWAREWGGSADEEPLDIQLDSSGNIYVAGHTFSYAAGDNDSLLLKYGPSGGFLWAATWGGVASDNASEVEIGSDGLAYVVGGTQSYGVGGNSVILLKYDYLNGNLVSADTWSTSGWDGAYASEITSDGSLLIGGFALNAHGSWQNVSGVSGSPTGADQTATGALNTSPSGVDSYQTGTASTPLGVSDEGGGDYDSLAMKTVP